MYSSFVLGVKRSALSSFPADGASAPYFLANHQEEEEGEAEEEGTAEEETTEEENRKKTENIKTTMAADSDVCWRLTVAVLLKRTFHPVKHV